MRVLGRLRLQTKVLLMQIGIVVLVAALMSGAIVSVLARVVAQQSGERVLGIAHTVALMPAVRDAFNSPDPPAIIQPLAESVRQAAGVSFVVVANRDLIRYAHPSPDLIG
ncbi:MAG TPA: sensor histidine kinase, partial [Chloroflexota bacterium]|nr:sensor histidine kinase [Chloroflexota bacterium]